MTAPTDGTAPLKGGVSNPPAFPTKHVYVEGRHSGLWQGMTLRDWFAGQALAAGLVPPRMDEMDWSLEAMAAYEIADAMLAARKAGEA